MTLPSVAAAKTADHMPNHVNNKDGNEFQCQLELILAHDS